MTRGLQPGAGGPSPERAGRRGSGLRPPRRPCQLPHQPDQAPRAEGGGGGRASLGSQAGWLPLSRLELEAPEARAEGATWTALRRSLGCPHAHPRQPSGPCAETHTRLLHPEARDGRPRLSLPCAGPWPRRGRSRALPPPRLPRGRGAARKAPSLCGSAAPDASPFPDATASSDPQPRVQAPPRAQTGGGGPRQDRARPRPRPRLNGSAAPFAAQVKEPRLLRRQQTETRYLRTAPASTELPTRSLAPGAAWHPSPTPGPGARTAPLGTVQPGVPALPAGPPGPPPPLGLQHFLTLRGRTRRGQPHSPWLFPLPGAPFPNVLTDAPLFRSAAPRPAAPGPRVLQDFLLCQPPLPLPATARAPRGAGRAHSRASGNARCTGKAASVGPSPTFAV